MKLHYGLRHTHGKGHRESLDDDERNKRPLTAFDDKGIAEKA